MKKLLVTGSSGLVGSEVCIYFSQKGYMIFGIDNNQRSVFFGPNGDTRWNRERLQQLIPDYVHHDLDIRDRAAIADLLKTILPDAVIHTAAQPSHDKAAQIPYDDFDTNAVGTLNVLEALRQANPEAPFIHMSTNKVYGDGPNNIRMKESGTRWEYDDPNYENGIPESFPIDQTKHSIFGISKVAADVMVQEYGRYFNMPTCCLRGGCLTGPNHSGVELHGFLSYLVKCNVEGKKYAVNGYKGKQVRDNIHSYDIARFMDAFINAPRIGEVYNLGGGKKNTCSILEAFDMAEKCTGKKQVFEYVEKNRDGDHICYYSDLRKMKSHYPAWDISISLEEIIQQIVAGWIKRLKHEDTVA
ncbi:MAG: NAD-dependent epimerase/dehydratase family protein [Bacteroidetes bacterium]|nr:NAD-dependent epimerase/dehydratase family protein [Bacteroidota bacterium]